MTARGENAVQLLNGHIEQAVKVVYRFCSLLKIHLRLLCQVAAHQGPNFIFKELIARGARFFAPRIQGGSERAVSPESFFEVDLKRLEINLVHFSHNAEPCILRGRLDAPLQDARSAGTQAPCIIDHTREPEYRRVHQVVGVHVRIERQPGPIRCKLHVFEHVLDKFIMLFKALFRAQTEVLLLQVEPLLLDL